MLLVYLEHEPSSWVSIRGEKTQKSSAFEFETDRPYLRGRLRRRLTPNGTQVAALVLALSQSSKA